MDHQTQVLYEFSGFRLDPDQRILMHGGELVSLTPKGFEALLFLVQNSGRVLEKDELMKALWPESFVEEGNLSQQIFLLRKALGDDQNGHSFIRTIPRRGYKFVVPVKQLTIARAANSNGCGQSLLSTEYWREHSPFRGLQVFEPDDAWLFFGRDAEIAELVARLDRSPVLVVIGNSGCGKSSLVRAGLIPALRAGRFRNGEATPDDWRAAIVRPSASPFDYLAEVLPNQLAPELSLREQAEVIADCRNKLPLATEALLNTISALANATEQQPTHARILLVVDQFEELFTLTASGDARERYINALLAASRCSASVCVYVVLVLRADFYSHCIEHPGLSRSLEANVYNVPRMTHDQLRESIEKRLEIANAVVEPGLTESLLDDVGTEPGDLALLEHALTQLWEKCGGFGCTLTSSAYSAIGRLRGALSAHADGVYAAISDGEQKRLGQKIFLELVHLGEGSPDTRRRVTKEQLLALGPPEKVEALLARLASSRLITISREGQQIFVEVSHEALIREWSSLREWIARNREEIQLGRRLAQAAQEWDGLNRDAGALLQGARLAQGKEWLLRHADAPAAPELAREFVEASVAAREEAGQRELRKQKAAASRLRWFSSALASLLLVALGAAWFAHRQQVLAEARTLAAQSEQMLGRDQGRALDLAIRGWITARTGETYLALTKALPQTLSILHHDGEIVVSVFSPDGQRILTASWDHTARVWNAADGHLLATLQGHAGPVLFAAFSPDGQHIVTASGDHTARVWNTADGRLLATLKGHSDKVARAEFSPDGQCVVTASSDHTARVWNASDGRLLAVLSGHTHEIWGATFSPDGQRIATTSLDQTARIWNATDFRLLVTLQAHTGLGYRPEFSPDSQRLVTASADHTARVWNVADGRLVATLGHEGVVERATFSPDGRRIATASFDHTARIWDASDGRLLATLPHDGVVHHVEFSPDGKLIVTGSYDTMARVWSVSDGRLLATLQGHTAPVMHASFSPDGQRIVTGSLDHTARVWNLAGGHVLSTLQGPKDVVWLASFSPDNQRILASSFDRSARVWSIADGQLLLTLGHAGRVLQAVFSPDGQQILTASADHTARVWNVFDGRLLATLRHDGVVQYAQFSPQDPLIVTASHDRTARIWNLADGHLLAKLSHDGSVFRAAFSPDGKSIVTASADHTARVWNTAEGHLRAVLQHTDPVWTAEFSPDGQRIVTAGKDGTARIWNASDGRLLATLRGHTDAINSAAFSPDSQRVVTASIDQTARVWNASDGRLLATLRGHTQGLYRAEFSVDGRRLLTASYDDTARVWNASDGKLLAALQGYSGPVPNAEFSLDGQRIVTASWDQTVRIWQVLTLDDLEKMLAEPCPACPLQGRAAPPPALPVSP